MRRTGGASHPCWCGPVCEVWSPGCRFGAAHRDLRRVTVLARLKTLHLGEKPLVLVIQCIGIKSRVLFRTALLRNSKNVRPHTPDTSTLTERARSTTVARTHAEHKIFFPGFSSPARVRARARTPVGGGRARVCTHARAGCPGSPGVRARNRNAHRAPKFRLISNPSPTLRKISTLPRSQRSPAPTTPQHRARGHRTIIDKAGPGRASCTEKPVELSFQESVNPPILQSCESGGQAFGTPTHRKTLRAYITGSLTGNPVTDHT